MNMEGLPFTDEIGNEVLNVGGVTLAAGLHSGDYSALLNTSKYLCVKDPTPRNIVAEPFTLECTFEKTATGSMYLFSSVVYNSQRPLWELNVTDTADNVISAVTKAVLDKISHDSKDLSFATESSVELASYLSKKYFAESKPPVYAKW